jgi:2-polyprenyl-6-methoxyphenol hydroxylase-like FAD-dependent oxidoreductase
LGGQNIDVKGPAWEIVKKMGLEQKIREANTTEIGIRFVNTRNKIVAEFAKDDALSMTQELEILRGDLVSILYEQVKEGTEFHFGDSIETLIESSESVDVKFKSGLSGNFDLAIIAEGIGSKTRQLIFGKEVQFRYLGVYTAYFTIPKVPTDDEWARWCNAPEGIVFLIRPDNHGTTRASINFRSPERGYEKLPVNEQKQLLIDKIKHVAWEAPRLAEAIQKSDDFYLERLSQVKAPHWHQGRVAMIGDAAYCVTPIGGKGTDLAIAGAYLVAGELSKNDNHQKAFEAYENRLRPYVDKVQKLPPGVPRLVYPTSKTGVAILNFFFSLAGSKAIKFVLKMLGKNKKQPKKEFQLPNYK